MIMMSVTNLMYYVFKLLKSFDIVSVINVLTSRAKPKKKNYVIRKRSIRSIIELKFCVSKIVYFQVKL